MHVILVSVVGTSSALCCVMMVCWARQVTVKCRGGSGSEKKSLFSTIALSREGKLCFPTLRVRFEYGIICLHFLSFFSPTINCIHPHSARALHTGSVALGALLWRLVPRRKFNPPSVNNATLVLEHCCWYCTVRVPVIMSGTHPSQPGELGSVQYAYGGTGPKFCRFHKRGPPSPPPVEPTKLKACTSVYRGGTVQLQSFVCSTRGKGSKSRLWNIENLGAVLYLRSSQSALKIQLAAFFSPFSSKRMSVSSSSPLIFS